MAPPGHPTIRSAFLSVKPFEPVLVFDSQEEAKWFQDKNRQGRILLDQSSKWVFIPLPDGLLRVRTAKDGDIAFDFNSPGTAKWFNDSINSVGRIFPRTVEKPGWDRTVYIGKGIK